MLFWDDLTIHTVIEIFAIILAAFIVHFAVPLIKAAFGAFLQRIALLGRVDGIPDMRF